MIMKIKLISFLIIFFGTAITHANVCGTDFQNFNPTTNGLDFVTVQSSETLKPCFINMGMFVNYAVNSLTYSKTLNANYPPGQKRQDKMVGADLSLGMGLTNRWDFGVNVPFILSQKVEDDYYVSSYDKTGITEVKANTKYHLLGDETGGLAVIVSLNKNLIEDNPFAGKDPGLTWNFELAADTTFAKNWAVGINGGYRKRDSGAPLLNVPFIPLRNQWIYSTAASYLIASIDTKVIFELYGSQAVNSEDHEADRAMNTLEGLVGLKHDYSQNLAMHFGIAKQIDNSLGGAEWRTYAGINWAIGPVCKKPIPAITPVQQKINSEPAAPEVPSKVTAQEPQVYQLDTEVFFKTNSDKIEEENVSALTTFFQTILNQKFSKLVIEGHTDSVGPEEYNIDLSQRRAKFVKELLIEKYKVPAQKIETLGYGSSHPVEDNGNYQGRQKNRRVEFKVWQ
jgi:outer membrane protein OmpA-like peptidoglycan-associated protein